jgi:hypothetical protein
MEPQYGSTLVGWCQSSFSVESFFFIDLLFTFMFLYFSLFSLIYGFNCNWFIRFGFTYPSLFFCQLCDLNYIYMNIGSLDFYLYCSKHLKWENIYNTYMHQTDIIVMSSILRWKIVYNSASSICRSKSEV